MADTIEHGMCVVLAFNNAIVPVYTASKSNPVEHWILRPLWSKSTSNDEIRRFHSSWLKPATPHQIAEWRKITNGKNIEVNFNEWAQKCL